jgi:hypothetical protein
MPSFRKVGTQSLSQNWQLVTPCVNLLSRKFGEALSCDISQAANYEIVFRSEKVRDWRLKERRHMDQFSQY